MIPHHEGAATTAPDTRTLPLSYVSRHWCTFGCAKNGCDIKETRVWHHEEHIRYTPEEMAESARAAQEWFARNQSRKEDA